MIDLATRQEQKTSRSAMRLGPDLYEKVLAFGAMLLLALIAIALARGQSAWSEIPPVVAIHLATVLLPLALTPLMMLRVRGDRWHRRLGWVWTVSIFATAAVSFGVRTAGDGGFSVIHILSGVTVIWAPLLLIAARRHNIRRHRRAARGLVTGALLVAGYFTLLPQRMLGAWLWG